MTDSRAARTTLATLAATALLATIPAGTAAQEGGADRPEPDSTAAEQLRELADRMTHVTNHLEQMSKTLRQNPELEERWASPAAFDRMIRVGAMVEAVTLQASSLGRELRRSPAGEPDPVPAALGDVEADLRRGLSDLVPALRSLVEAAAGLADAAHAGEGGGHAH